MVTHLGLTELIKRWDFNLYFVRKLLAERLKNILGTLILLLTGLMIDQQTNALCFAQDWPMWRYDSSRSASSDNYLSEELQLRWVIENSPRKQAWDDPLNHDLMTYDRVFEPIVTNGLVIVPYNDESKVVAYSIEDGSKCWTFFTEAPVRLPAASANGKVCFCSDDGYLYCVESNTGQLLWKFFGGSNQQHALGNRRLVSAWPARGGPVIRDGHVYFSASIWPFMGVFIYALELETGAVHWINDQSGSTYIKQPHSAPSFAGVAPQGAFAATKDHLLIPGGRSVPAVLDRYTGELKHFELNAGGKGNGGSFVVAEESRYFVHTRRNGTRAFSMQDGKKQNFTPNRPVLSHPYLYSADEESDGVKQVRCYDKDNQRVWSIAVDGTGDLIRCGSELIAVGGGDLTRLKLPDQGAAPMITQTVKVPEDARRILVANESLLLVTESGLIQSYGDADPAAVVKTWSSNLTATTNVESFNASTKPSQRFLVDLKGMNQHHGYALWFGGSETDDLKNFILATDYDQIIVVDPRADLVNRLRKWLDDRGLHGRVTAHCSEIKDFRAPKYIASSIVLYPGGRKEFDMQDLQIAYQSVRPYGGVLLLAEAELESTLERERDQIDRLEQVVVSQHAYGVVLKRMGRLPGSADWTHQYGDVANTIKSDDQRVKLPLGVLWFGGTSHLDVLPRHGHGPPEQVVGGRLFIQGLDCLSARDVYTGRLLWKREFQDLGTFDVYYDSTFEDTPLNPKYNQVHIPGANGRGTNYVVTEDRVYLAAQDQCYVLDTATGETKLKIKLPNSTPEQGSDNGKDVIYEWGYLAVYGDLLIGGLGFANYRNQMSLEYENDKKLSRSRQGFGGKSVDRAASRALVGFDRHTGELLWEIPANYSFWHNGIVAGGDQIYCLDRYPIRVEQALMRRGTPAPDSYRIAAFNSQSGELAWEIKEGVFGSWLSYSEEFDLLLQAGAAASDRLTDEISKGMAVYRAGDGSLKWRNDDLRYTGPCILHHDWIITNTNSYADSAGAFFLHDGHRKMVSNPITGKSEPWHLTRAYGCNHIIASENMLTFRSGSAGYYDLLQDGGTGNFGGFKSGCTSNLVVANGVLNAPDYTRTCSCAYQNQTSLALVHMPEVELWSVDDFAISDGLSGPIKHLGINFGAPGDRRDQEGNLWLEYPVVAGESIDLDFTWNPDAKVLRNHSSRVKESQYSWLFASGLEGVNQLQVGFQQQEKELQTPTEPNYEVTIFIGAKDTRAEVKLEATLQDEKRSAEFGGTSSSKKQKTGRVTFTGVSLRQDLKVDFQVLSGRPVICGMELRRE